MIQLNNIIFSRNNSKISSLKKQGQLSLCRYQNNYTYLRQENMEVYVDHLSFQFGIIRTINGW
jgi:hypothetical protein